MVERLQVSIESKLYEITEEKLQSLAEYLNIKGIEGLSKLQIIRKIRRSVEQHVEEEGNAEQDIEVYWQDIEAFMTDKPPPLEVTNEPEQEEGSDVA